MSKQENLPVFLRALWLLEIFYFGNIFNTEELNVLLQCNNCARLLEIVALNFQDLSSSKLPLSFPDIYNILRTDNPAEKLKMLIESFPKLLCIGFTKEFIMKLYIDVNELDHIPSIIDCANNLLQVNISIEIVFAFVRNDITAGIKSLRAVFDRAKWLFDKHRVGNEELDELVTFVGFHSKFTAFLEIAPKLTKHGFTLKQIAVMAATEEDHLQSLNQLAQDLDLCDSRVIFNQDEKNRLRQCDNFVRLIRFIVDKVLPLTDDPVKLTGVHICRIARSNNPITKLNRLLDCPGIMRLIGLDTDHVVMLLECDNGLENIDVVTTMAYPLVKKGFKIHDIFGLLMNHGDNGARVIKAIHDNARWLMIEQKFMPAQILDKINTLREIKRFLAIMQYGPELTSYKFTFDQLFQIACLIKDPDKTFRGYAVD